MPLGPNKLAMLQLVSAWHFLFSLPLLLLFCYGRALVQIFANDEQSLNVCEECWCPFLAALMLMMSLAIAIKQTPYSMGCMVTVF